MGMLGMCVYMCTDVCTDMCVDMCIDWQLTTGAADESMYVDMCADMRDVCMNKCIDMLNIHMIGDDGRQTQRV